MMGLRLAAGSSENVSYGSARRTVRIARTSLAATGDDAVRAHPAPPHVTSSFYFVSLSAWGFVQAKDSRPKQHDRFCYANFVRLLMRHDFYLGSVLTPPAGGLARGGVQKSRCRSSVVEAITIDTQEPFGVVYMCLAIKPKFWTQRNLHPSPSLPLLRGHQWHNKRQNKKAGYTIEIFVVACSNGSSR